MKLSIQIKCETFHSREEFRDVANWVVGHPIDPHVIEVNFLAVIFNLNIINNLDIINYQYHQQPQHRHQPHHRQPQHREHDDDDHNQVVYTLLDEDGDQNLSTKEFNPVKIQ